MERDKAFITPENPHILKRPATAAEILRSAGVTSTDLVKASRAFHESNPKLYPTVLNLKGRRHRATDSEIHAFLNLREL